ncbi:glutamine amidotransferase [Cellulomonas timonensis]|uniref:glutamine amidotransferase n=1 Tax=Cellulomonas timonensis TaxID=1689271 RepID=UPI00083615A3|nr:glutamine amidotransferase [Cellulomonas timonensis]
MSHVLVIGESWFVHSIHQKGFDTFTTSEYEEGGGAFLAALRERGHEVTYVPSHTIHERLPVTVEGYAPYDVVVISDVGANSFQLPPQTFSASVPSPDKSELVRAHVERGAGLLMVGGYMTFSGIDAKARWGRSPLGEALPVSVLDRDDRVELPYGAQPRVIAEHDVVAGLAPTWPVLLGLNEVVAKDDAQVLATCAEHPLLVVGGYGAGRTGAFTSDIAPHWAPPEFLDWDGYAELWDRLVTWLAG